MSPGGHVMNKPLIAERQFYVYLQNYRAWRVEVRLCYGGFILQRLYRLHYSEENSNILSRA